MGLDEYERETFVNSTEWKATVSTVVVLWLIVALVLLPYFFYVLYKERHILFVSRFRRAILGMIILSMLGIIQTSCGQLMDYAPYLIPIVFLLLPTIYLYSFLFLWRLWMIRYNIELADCCARAEWVQIIDPIANVTQNNFWIQRKSTLGNGRYMAKIALITAVVFSIVDWLVWASVVASGHLYWIPNLIEIILYSITWVAIIYVYRSLRDFDDVTLVRLEMKWVFRSELCQILGYFVGYFASIFVDKPRAYQNIWISVATIFVIGKALTGFVTTIWIKRILYESVLNKEKQKSSQSRTQFAGRERSHSTITLEFMLNNNRGYSLVMSSLSSELSVEILVGFTELLQFQHCVSTQFTIDTNSIPHPTKAFKLAPNVPRSAVVYRDLSELSSGLSPQLASAMEEYSEPIDIMKIRAYLLFEKYIRARTSEYELNLSYPVRQKLTESLADFEIWMAANVTDTDLYRLFLDALRECYVLLTFALTRLKVRNTEILSKLTDNTSANQSKSAIEVVYRK